MTQDSRLYLPNLKANKVFQDILYTDGRLSIVFKLNQTWERVRDDEEKFKKWMSSFQSVDEVLKLELLPFFFGIIMDRRQEEWYKDIVLMALDIVVALVEFKKEVSVQLLPILLYKLANDASPSVKLECLKALPLMAKTKVSSKFEFSQKMFLFNLGCKKHLCMTKNAPPIVYGGTIFSTTYSG